jgi:hypothetical protein
VALMFPVPLRCSRVRSKAVRANFPLVMKDSAAGDIPLAAMSRASIKSCSPSQSPYGTLTPTLNDDNAKRPPSRVTGNTT